MVMRGSHPGGARRGTLLSAVAGLLGSLALAGCGGGGGGFLLGPDTGLPQAGGTSGGQTVDAQVAAATSNPYAFHVSSGTASSDACVRCHTTVASRDTANPSEPDAHVLHIGVTTLTCTSCHGSTNLGDGSGAALRKQVDPELCKNCHDGTTAPRLFAD